MGIAGYVSVCMLLYCIWFPLSFATRFGLYGHLPTHTPKTKHIYGLTLSRNVPFDFEKRINQTVQNLCLKPFSIYYANPYFFTATAITGKTEPTPLSLTT
jgi:hypothetical protein